MNLPAKLYLTPSYTYTETVRTDGDVTLMNDDIFSANLKWKWLSLVVPKVVVEYVKRTSYIANVSTATKSNNFGQLRFDVAPMNKMTYTA